MSRRPATAARRSNNFPTSRRIVRAFVGSNHVRISSDSGEVSPARPRMGFFNQAACPAAEVRRCASGIVISPRSSRCSSTTRSTRCNSGASLGSSTCEATSTLSPTLCAAVPGEPLDASHPAPHPCRPTTDRRPRGGVPAPSHADDQRPLRRCPQGLGDPDRSLTTSATATSTRSTWRKQLDQLQRECIDAEHFLDHAVACNRYQPTTRPPHSPIGCGSW